MNKVILMGRLVREPEVRYSQGATPVAVARYTLAVSRRLKKEGEPEADFINCVAFGKSGEFVEKFFRKGQMVSVVGRLQVRTWDDKDGTKRWSTEVVTEEHYFVPERSPAAGGGFAERNAESGSRSGFAKQSADNAESKKSESYTAQPETQKQLENQESRFYPIEGIDDEDLPF